MAKKQPVGVGLFEKKKDAGVPKHSPAECGTVVPTTKGCRNLGTSKSKNSKRTHKKQAK